MVGRCACSLISDIDTITSYFIILPHISKLNRSKLSGLLKNAIVNICSFLSGDCLQCCSSFLTDNTDSLLIPKSLAILSLALETVIKLKFEPPSSICSPDAFLNGVLKFCQNEEHLSALRALDFYIVSDELNSVVDFASQIKEKIWLNLMSPYHKVGESYYNKRLYIRFSTLMNIMLLLYLLD